MILCGMLDLCRIIIGIVLDLFRPRAALEAEILLLRQQIIVLRRGSGVRLAFMANCSGLASTLGRPASPWQNGIAERLIGTLRHECLDRMLIFGESHLRRVLSAYAAYYNQSRTHLALQKDAPSHRAVQRFGVIV